MLNIQYETVQCNRLPCLRVWGDTLQQGQGVAHSVGLVSSERRGVDGRVDVHYFLRHRIVLTKPCSNRTLWNRGTVYSTHLQKCCDRAAGVPQHGRQVRHGLALLAELQQGVLSGLRTGQLVDPLVDLLPVHLGQGRHVTHSLQEGGQIIITNHSSESLHHKSIVRISSSQINHQNLFIKNQSSESLHYWVSEWPTDSQTPGWINYWVIIVSLLRSVRLFVHKLA